MTSSAERDARNDQLVAERDAALAAHAEATRDGREADARRRYADYQVAIGALIEANAALAFSYANRFTSRAGAHDREDIEAAALGAIASAAMKYVAGRGSFTGFTYQLVRVAVQREARLVSMPNLSEGDFRARVNVLQALARMTIARPGESITAKELAAAAGTSVDLAERIMHPPRFVSLSGAGDDDDDRPYDGPTREGAPDVIAIERVDREAAEFARLHGVSRAEAMHRVVAERLLRDGLAADVIESGALHLLGLDEAMMAEAIQAMSEASPDSLAVQESVVEADDGSPAVDGDLLAEVAEDIDNLRAVTDGLDPRQLYVMLMRSELTDPVGERRADLNEIAATTGLGREVIRRTYDAAIAVARRAVAVPLSDVERGSALDE